MATLFIQRAGRLWVACLTCVLLLVSATAQALGEPNYIQTEAGASGFNLRDADIHLDGQLPPGVVFAAEALQRDLKAVTGRRPGVVRDSKSLPSHPVLVGIIGQSPRIDTLIAQGRLDVSGIEGRFDAYHLQLLEQPLAGVDSALVVVGSDMRGAIYGLFDISEKIGVSPFYYWADVPIQPQAHLMVEPGMRVEDYPRVRYRGIFLNDEAPALTNWVQANHGDYNHEFYVKVFELLLRLKANFLWPAMWNNAFADDDPENAELADRYGIVMSTSHHEPMMRAHKEWARYGKGAWDYSKNAQVLRQFWRDGLERERDHEHVITLGMRGDGDEPMSEGENIELLEKIVTDQRSLIKDVFGSLEVPQVWTLYKEVQDYYDQGMRVPDDVILLWADDNWGNIRRLPTPEERKRAGGAGVYYHFDYVGGPRSYRWINVTPVAKIWEQMNLAWEYGAREIWVTNVGDLKPMEYPIEFFLRMAWDPERWPRERVDDYGRLFAEREFGAEHAAEIAALIEGYTRHNGRRKPELMAPDTYSLLHYREAERIEAELDELLARAEALAERLPDNQRAAFDQLVLYPIQGTRLVTLINIAAGRNHLYAQQRRNYANAYADHVQTLFEQFLALRAHWDKNVARGKWQHFMDQPVLGYLNWNNPPADSMPITYRYEPHGEAEMGVAIEGEASAWPAPAQGADYQLSFTPFGQTVRTVTLFNRGTRDFEYTATPSHDWIQVTPRIEGSVKLDVSIDWDKLPAGSHQGSLSLNGTSWETARIKIEATKPEPAVADQASGFVEGDGYVSIEAAHFQRAGNTSQYQWQEIPLHGRTLSSISTFPIDDNSSLNFENAAYVEYDLTLFTPGEITITALLAPSWPMVPGRGLRYAVAVDDEQPQVVDFVSNWNEKDWEQSVADGVRRGISRHTVEQAGNHKLRIYRVDPGVTLQKLMIDTGGLKPSYLGPPESTFAERPDTVGN